MQTREAGWLRLDTDHRKFFSPFPPINKEISRDANPTSAQPEPFARLSCPASCLCVSCLHLAWKYTSFSLSVFVQAAGQRLSGPVAAATARKGGGYRSIYIHFHHEHEPLNQQSEEPNLSDTDASKRRIHTRIFQLLSVSFSSFPFTITYCRNVKGVIEMLKENKYHQDEDGLS